MLWPDEEKVQPLAAQIGWAHHQVLLDAFGKAPDLYAWYVAKTIENRWSRRHLQGQIDLKLHLRYGAATANYAAALGEVEGHAALAVTKDPYVLDFIDITEDAKERELEDALVREIPRFLRELGDQTVAKFALHRSGAPIAIADWQTDLNVDIADDIPQALRAELAGMPEVRDRLTTHVADTAERVEARLLEVSRDDDAT